MVKAISLTSTKNRGKKVTHSRAFLLDGTCEIPFTISS